MAFLRQVLWLGKKVLFISGFEITIEHPHTDVVKCTQLVRGKWSLKLLNWVLMLSIFCNWYECYYVHPAFSWVFFKWGKCPFWSFFFFFSVLHLSRHPLLFVILPGELELASFKLESLISLKIEGAANVRTLHLPHWAMAVWYKVIFKM